MKKKEYDWKKDLGLVMVFIIFVLQVIILSEVPMEYCELIESTTSIDVAPHSYPEHHYNRETTSFVCEDGVGIVDLNFLGEIALDNIKDVETKTCLMTTKTKVCEIK